MKKKFIIGGIFVICMLMTTSCATAAVNQTSTVDQKKPVMKDNNGWPLGLWNFVKNRYYSLVYRADYWYGLSGDFVGGPTHPLFYYHAVNLYNRADRYIVFWLLFSERLGWSWPGPVTD